MKKRIGVIFGGNSVEHDISVLTMLQVKAAIDTSKFEYVLIYLTREGNFLVGPKFDELYTYQNNKYKFREVSFHHSKNKLIIKSIKGCLFRYVKEIDVILPLVHGKNLEDGTLAGFFKILNIPYASSSVESAAILQNKYITKKLLKQEGINVTPYLYLKKKDYLEDSDKVLASLLPFGFPVIIKPVLLGSSVGISIGEDINEAKLGINYAFKFEEKVIVEKKLEKFREFNQAVIKTTDGYIYSNIEEVINADGYLTFNDKYLSSMSKRIIPAEVSNAIFNSINDISAKVINIFDIRGVIRIDYLYDEDTDTIYVNEINTIPGSLSYYLFEDKISFPNLIETLINSSIKDKYLDDLLVQSFKSNVLFSKSNFKNKVS